MSRTSRRSWLVVVALSVAFAFPGTAAANHSWGGYHWARTANPFTLNLGDNVSSTWDSYLATTSSDWSVSAVLDTTVVPGLASKSRLCRPTTGRVEVCNATYGNNGWLGVASISITGGVHITKGTVKVNDTYFNTAQYNTAAWRNLVMCQEVGHTLGLDHQDVNFSNANLGTCMDYTSDPSTNQYPNQHDYDELETIYAHLDSTTTVGQSAPGSSAAEGAEAAEAAEAAGEWGRLIATSNGGRTSVFQLDADAGQSVITFVIWAR